MLEQARLVAADIGRLLGVEVDADTVLAGRAALLGLEPPSRVSAGGATRLLPTADGWCAVALPRDDDVDALPALLGVDALDGDHWAALGHWAIRRSTGDVVERAQLLDIAAAALGEAMPSAPRVRRNGIRVTPRRAEGLLVADLSSLWAGPLCGRLLARAGAVVVKVESPSRPDGTRRGRGEFFDWMNSQKLSYAIDFGNGGLERLLHVADIVIEGSRASALARRRLGVHDIAGPPGRIWLRINGYRNHPERPAFGDDAAVAGGLVGAGPVFYGDAIADPLSGLEAARAVGESLGRGGGELIEVSMAQVAAGYSPTGPVPVIDAPATGAPAPALGADNDAVERLVAQRLSAAC